MTNRPFPLLGSTLVCLALCTVPAVVYAQRLPPILKLSLDDLMQIEVTSVSKKEEKLAEAPSAIFVLTHDDLARSGVTTVAEALRLVPGMDVARIDANKWAISARGFTGRFADKMLVLIDGRSVYTPLFSGVYWDVQDTLLADIDRIEVIRGPGATLWGANAVNGVINIITKSAQETQGMLGSLRTGADEHAVLEARYGGAWGNRTHYRGFVKLADRGPFVDADGGDSSDDSRLYRAGVRFDSRPSPASAVMLEAQGYGGSVRTSFGPGTMIPFYNGVLTSTAQVSGGHVLGRWTRALRPRSDVSLQSYVDYTNRNEPMLHERRHTVDVEFQHHTASLPRQDIVWGSGFRLTQDRIRGSAAVQFSQTSRADALVNVFAQNEITVVPDRLRLTGGIKLEHNSYTRWEWQPDVRVLLLVDRRQTIWGAVSRAVRTPSRAETDVTINSAPFAGPTGLPVLTSLRGSPTFQSETLRSHEIGYRVQPSRDWSFDVAAFANRYHHLRTFEPGTPAVAVTTNGPAVLVPVFFDNLMRGQARGAEVVGRWTPFGAWRLDATYTYLDVVLRPDATSQDTFGIYVEDSSPRHQARLQSALVVGRGMQVDAAVARVGSIRRAGVPAYLQFDARLAWHSRHGLTLEAGGRNLLDHRHREFASTLGELPTWSRRSLFAGATWVF